MRIQNNFYLVEVGTVLVTFLKVVISRNKQMDFVITRLNSRSYKISNVVPMMTNSSSLFYMIPRFHDFLSF